MAGKVFRFLSPEKALFGALVALLGFLAWRAAEVEPMPGLPGAPCQKNVTVAGQVTVDPKAAEAALLRLLAQGSRNPFEPAFDSLRVVAATFLANVTVSPEGAAADVTVHYRILPNPVQRFEFLVPPGVSLTEVDRSGSPRDEKPLVKNLGRDGNQFTIRLRSPVDKKYTVRLKLYWPKEPGADVVRIPEILMPDTTSDRGIIAISTKLPRTPVTVVAARNVEPVPLDNLPPELAGRSCFAAFRYQAHPYAIELNVKKPEPLAVAKEPPSAPLPPKAPGTRLVNPAASGQNNAGAVKPVAWAMPVSFKGTVKVGSRRCVLLQDTSGNMFRKFEGDKVQGITIIEIRPTSVILRNDEGELFEFKDDLRTAQGD